MENSVSAGDKLNKVLPAFKNSLSEAFETMVFTKAVCGDSVSKHGHFPTGAISGTIGLTGEHVNGRMTLIFPTNAAEQAFRGMMMMGPDDPVDEAELKDAIGELANMTAGGAKAVLQQENVNFLISLPAVVVGMDHHLDSPKGCASIVIPVALDDKLFHMELAIQ
jgi:chemotaxis protein CheX